MPVALMAIVLLAGCAERELWPEERLDPKTAVNVTIMAEPWIYFRDVPMLAANARDYLNVGVVETNRAGVRSYWLGVVAWSTIDRSVLPGVKSAAMPRAVRLTGASSSLELVPATDGRKAVQLSQAVFTDPQAAFTESWYPLTTEQLLMLGNEAPTAVTLISDEGVASTYGEWRIRPAALAEFLKATGLQ